MNECKLRNTGIKTQSRHSPVRVNRDNPCHKIISSSLPVTELQRNGAPMNYFRKNAHHRSPASRTNLPCFLTGSHFLMAWSRTCFPSHSRGLVRAAISACRPALMWPKRIRGRAKTRTRSTKSNNVPQSLEQRGTARLVSGAAILKTQMTHIKNQPLFWSGRGEVSSQGRPKLNHLSLLSAHSALKPLLISHCLVRKVRNQRRAAYCSNILQEYHHKKRKLNIYICKSMFQAHITRTSLLLWDCEASALCPSVLSVQAGRLRPSVATLTFDLWRRSRQVRCLMFWLLFQMGRQRLSTLQNSCRGRVLFTTCHESQTLCLKKKKKNMIPSLNNKNNWWNAFKAECKSRNVIRQIFQMRESKSVDVVRAQKKNILRKSCQQKRHIIVSMSSWRFQTVGVLGKRCFFFFSAAVKQSGGK